MAGIRVAIVFVVLGALGALTAIASHAASITESAVVGSTAPLEDSGRATQADGSDSTSNAASNMSTRTRYEMVRLQSFSEWWQMPLLVLLCSLVVAFVIAMYRRDSVELKPGVGIVLALLRLAAFVGLLLMYLDVERRTETKVVHHSRVVLLVDTSLSMSRVDVSAGSNEAIASSTGSGRRIDQVADTLADGKFLDALRQTHDVEVVKFDATVHRLAALQKISKDEFGSDRDKNQKESGIASTAQDEIDWKKELEPQGAETRIAGAVRQVLKDEQGAALSGIVVFTDGAQNAGVDVAAAIKEAKEAKIPIHAVGLGSAVRPTNVRVADLVAPARAYPGDSFRVTGYVQSQGLAGRSVNVELAVLAAGKAPPGKPESDPQFVKTERATLAGDNEMVPVRFDVPGIDIAGRRVVRLRILPIAEDKDPSDNEQEVDVEIVDRKNRVLLFAGGPSHEYQFLRNMLRRSEIAKTGGDMVVDVLLQSSGDGVSQDANQILDEFPRTMQQLSQYDTIVAFDPDSRELDPEQIALLEKWVGEESGGLIAIAGPVFTDAWAQMPSMGTIRKLYPVEFNRRLALLADSRYGSQQPWPLDFTREGLESEFLWPEDTSQGGHGVWDSFKGVYGYYRVRGPKLGAAVYAWYSDPEAAAGDQKPVYLAGQFYGSGRVFYLGSGEMWRLRELDEKYFDTFYTKLIRHASQGRLLRGSRLGSLLVERDRFVVGNTVVVRAQLSNVQYQPLDVPKLTLHVNQRDGAPLNVQLAADPARKGMYVGQFTVMQEGECRLELVHPDAPDEPITRRLQVFMPKLEQEKAERNDALLKELADGTGGQLYIGVPAALSPQSVKPLAAQLEDKTQTSYVAGRKDRVWEERWMHGLLGLIAGCLCAEWLLRRLCRLA